MVQLRLCRAGVALTPLASPPPWGVGIEAIAPEEDELQFDGIEGRDSKLAVAAR